MTSAICIWKQKLVHLVGCPVGWLDGTEVGCPVGLFEGTKEGLAVGDDVGSDLNKWKWTIFKCALSCTVNVLISQHFMIVVENTHIEWHEFTNQVLKRNGK